MIMTSVPRRTRVALGWFALACWAAVVLRLSALTPQEIPQTGFPLSDKIAHVVVYSIGGWLAATTLRITRRRVGVAGWLLPAVLLVAVFGILDEAFQTYTPGRTGGDVLDWFADVVGAAAGAGLSLWAHCRSPSRRTGPEKPPTAR